ncbi:MAG: hypothetical protein KAR35_02660 [Candidatus Heimdallarchaeota archaeon]|nr:hypothetical protein [Candidatus Heimdallarchaeota archaeon]MCK5048256.1 hypothetical protein [Candidatus Heimdallarchaeota archaeon]
MNLNTPENQKENKKLKTLFLVIFIWGIIRFLYSMYLVLKEMTSDINDPEPLLLMLTEIKPFLEPIAEVSKLILGKTISDLLFVDYAFGGISLALMMPLIYGWYKTRDKQKNIKTLITNYKKQEENALSRSISTIYYSREIFLIYSVIMILFILASLTQETWVDYSQVETWKVNLKHKQQISATFFLFIWLYYYYALQNTSKKAFKGATIIASRPGVHFFMISVMVLEVLASFSFFPGGYEEIIGGGQSWVSFDKLLHFLISVAIVFVIWSFMNGNKKYAGILTALGHVGWELFEYVLQPVELGYDTLRDETINITAVTLATIYLYKFESQQSIKLLHLADLELEEE